MIEGLIAIAVLLILVIGTGVPIGISLGVVGFVGFIAVAGFNPALGMLATLPYHISTNWAWVVIPMFMLLGFFASEGGAGRDLYDAAQKWLGNLHGGLLMSTVMGCAFFGFASGSSLGAASAFTTLALPEADRYGYDRGFTCGSIAAAGTLAALIPPSGMMVWYSVFTDVPLGSVLIAGIFPGILTAL